MESRLRFLWPNLITALSSVSALVAIYLAHAYPDRRFAVCFLVSALLDSLDGPIARRLNARSTFGNIYDSMSDLMAFGVAPGICLWLHGMVHPLVAAFYILCIQFRLTRFSAKPESPVPEKFFQGVSAPDSVYVGALIGMAFGGNYSLGFGVASLLAVCPWKLMPKQFKIAKLVLGLVTMLLFIKGF